MHLSTEGHLGVARMTCPLNCGLHQQHTNTGATGISKYRDTTNMGIGQQACSAYRLAIKHGKKVLALRVQTIPLLFLRYFLLVDKHLAADLAGSLAQRLPGTSTDVGNRH